MNSEQKAGEESTTQELYVEKHVVHVSFIDTCYEVGSRGLHFLTNPKLQCQIQAFKN